MIHHMSLPLPDPAAAAPKLAALTGGVALQAPSPPFPRGAWFVVLADEAGGMLELLPDRVVLDPAAPLGLGRRSDPPGRSAAHVLVTSPLGMDEIIGFAKAEGWRADAVDSGMFEIVKVWVQDAFLVEFISVEKADRYTKAFGAGGIAALDGKLRVLEADLEQKLLGVLPREKLEAILG